MKDGMILISLRVSIPQSSASPDEERPTATVFDAAMGSSSDRLNLERQLGVEARTPEVEAVAGTE
jgi:hypothetical protein